MVNADEWGTIPDQGNQQLLDTCPEVHPTSLNALGDIAW
jgi:hypothetical protein